jgi:hypothetical protein
MSKDKCENCGEELNEIEQQAKDEEKAEAWCCYDCFGDGSMGLTEHGKYVLLLAFAKRMTDIGDLFCTKDVEDLANKLLKEIGENK